MGMEQARRAVRRADEESGREGMGEWGEKVERVWEFLKESGGLEHLTTRGGDRGSRKRGREEDGGEEGEDVKMEIEMAS